MKATAKERTCIKKLGISEVGSACCKGRRLNLGGLWYRYLGAASLSLLGLGYSTAGLDYSTAIKQSVKRVLIMVRACPIPHGSSASCARFLQVFALELDLIVGVAQSGSPGCCRVKGASIVIFFLRFFPCTTIKIN